MPGSPRGSPPRAAHVLLTDHPQSSTAETVRLIRETGGIAQEFACDLLEDDAAERIAQAAIQAYGRIDILANNAGTNRREPIFEVTSRNLGTHLHD